MDFNILIVKDKEKRKTKAAVYAYPFYMPLRGYREDHQDPDEKPRPSATIPARFTFEAFQNPRPFQLDVEDNQREIGRALRWISSGGSARRIREIFEEGMRKNLPDDERERYQVGLPNSITLTNLERRRLGNVPIFSAEGKNGGDVHEWIEDIDDWTEIAKEPEAGPSSDEEGKEGREEKKDKNYEKEEEEEEEEEEKEEDEEEED